MLVESGGREAERGACAEGTRSLAMMSFMCGTVLVATATVVGEIGDRERLEGVKAIQAVEWGARFCAPRGSREGGEEGSELVGSVDGEGMV